MKKLYILLFLFITFVTSFAQWSPISKGKDSSGSEYYKLDIQNLKSQLTEAQESGPSAKPVEISIPILGEGVQVFEVYSLPVVVKELADKYDLGSYVGVAQNDKSKYIRFSLAPNDFQSMVIINGKYQFIQPHDKSNSVYRVHYKTKKTGSKPFTCSTDEPVINKKMMKSLFDKGSHFSNPATNFAKNSDQKYRTLRLVVSVTGEYTQYHGGTVAGALTAINATMTRVNGVFEKDFSLHLILQNYPNVIFTNAATDPYSPSNLMTQWNGQLQNTLTNQVGNANYDIGHLFGASGGGGNAGCIGCVCINPSDPTDTQKGSGYTSPANGQPEGDLFDIDYVAHEMGHQLGANHTFSHQLEGSGVNMEPGSGSTIMGYAGITGPNNNVQQNSDPYFHVASIEQVQNNLVDKTCDIEVDITNTPPTVPAFTDVTIPKKTAFVLSAEVTDAENDPLTYTWEEVDNAALPINKLNLGTTTTGASFRSVNPATTGHTRYFPEFSTVVAGVLDNANDNWESVSMVPRESKFALVVRDNHNIATQQQTAYGIQVVNVGDHGPFEITSNIGYNNAPASLTWDVVSTNTAPYNVENVKIDYSTNNGNTWTTLLASTPNDGIENIQFTNVPTGNTVILRVSAIGNVFYALKSINIHQVSPCDSNPTTGIQVTNVDVFEASANWNPMDNGTFILRYRKVGEPNWTTVPLADNAYNFTGLQPSTTYEFQVANLCSGTTGTFSNSVEFTTLDFGYCEAQAGSHADEYISNVTVTPTNNPVMNSQSQGSNYTDYTTDTDRLVKLEIGSMGNTISVTKSWTGQQYNEGVSAWIDFNRDGIFSVSEKILGTEPNVATPVVETFDVPANAYNGPEKTRMRVVLTYNAQALVCGSFEYGEVEDYAVELINNNFVCPTDIPTGLTISNITFDSASAAWTAIAGTTSVIRYREVGTATWTEVQTANNVNPLTGLNPDTEYEVQVATFCQNNVGDFSASVNFTTLSCPTDIPADLAVANVTSTSADVSWTVIAGTTTMLRYRVVGTATWTDVPVAGNTYALTGLAAGTEYEVQVANVCSGNIGPYSTSVTFTTSTVEWCDVSTNIANDEWISNVTVTPNGGVQMSNDSGASNYTNYSGDPSKLINLIIGSTGNQISVGKGWSGNNFTENVTVWIDFNRNGVFENSEKIMESPGSNTTPVTANFDVPGNAYSGPETTRMRVMLKFGGTFPNDACTNYTYGEIEDYAVKFGEPEACTINPPAGLTVNNITATSADLSWIAATGSVYHIRYRVLGSPNWITVNDLATSVYQLTNLTESTTYEVQVANTCNGTLGEFGTSVEFTTPSVQWCDIEVEDSDDEWISNVTIIPSEAPAVPMINNSAANNYIDYFNDSDKLVTVTAGSTGNQISVTKAWGSGAAAENVTAWIDFNRNGIFEDSEKIFQSPGNPTSPVTGLFDVPADAYVGPLKTRMRVMLKYGPTLPDNACINLFWGEVEDYGVLIKPAIPCNTEEPSNFVINNITQNSAELTWDQDPGGATYRLRYKAVNETTWTEVNLTTNTYVLNTLIPLTEYQIELSAVCSGTQVGNPYTTTFETKCNSATPTSLAVTQITSTTAEVTWDDVPNIGNAIYKFAYREVGAANWIEVDINAPTTNFSLTGLTPYTNYEVRVATECSGAVNTYTTPKVFTTMPTCEMAPTGLTVTNISTTQAQVDWDAYETNEYVLRWRKVGNNPWNTVQLTVNTYVIQGLQELTQYEVQIAKVCGGGIQTFTQPYEFTTPSIIYCDASGSADSTEYISNVTVTYDTQYPIIDPVTGNVITEMSNDSQASTYTSYVDEQDKVITLYQGSQNNTLSVAKSWRAAQENEGIIAWIDFNRDGIFTDNEIILKSEPSKETPVMATFNVPDNAFVSLTENKFVVMRVAMKRDGLPIACGVNQFGEVEDYKVRISKGLPTNLIDTDVISIYPNPATDVINITNVEDGDKFEIYDASGRIVKKGKIAGNKVHIENLVSGVYIIVINTKDADAQIKFIKE